MKLLNIIKKQIFTNIKSYHENYLFNLFKNNLEPEWNLTIPYEKRLLYISYK